jgi:spermidine/putrescine-binding protein
LGLNLIRQDIDAVYGKKTPDWLVGFTHKNTIFILNSKFYTKESSHKSLKDFWKTLKHEYCHLYYKKLTGNTYPDWLNEGLACYLANQKKSKPELHEALSILEDKNQGKYDVYKVGYFWIKLLIEKYGKKKFFDLIGAVKPQITRLEFGKIFYRVFKIKFTQKSLGNFYSRDGKN